jgi:hypothetical protein
MPQLSDQPIRADTVSPDGGVRYSICTLMTRPAQYAEMTESFRRMGFDGDDCEYLFLDNAVSNRYDAYTGLNLFLSVARGRYVILCHQDILLEQDGREQLDRVLADMDRRDPAWAVCGNSGGISPGRLAIRITDPHGADQRTEDFPARVYSLDENFIVVKAAANLGLSRDMSGFHLYGTDLCIQADLLGWHCYVIDFHLRHHSPGVRDASLEKSRKALVDKYTRAFRMRWVTAPCEIVFLSSFKSLSRPLSARPFTRLLDRFGKRFPGLMSRLYRRPRREAARAPEAERAHG